MMTIQEMRIFGDIVASKIAEKMNSEEFLDKRGLAEFLKLSVSYIDKHREQFPHVKIGGSIRFPKSKIIQKIMNQE